MGAKITNIADAAAAKKPFYALLSEDGEKSEIDCEIARTIHMVFQQRNKLKDQKKAFDSLVDTCGKMLVEHLKAECRITGELGNVTMTLIPIVRVNNTERIRVVLQEKYPDRENIFKELDDEELIDLATDADDPLAPRIRECITIKYQPVIFWSRPGLHGFVESDTNESTLYFHRDEKDGSA